MGGTDSSAKQTVLNQTDLNLSQSQYNTISQSCVNVGSASNVVNVVGSSNVHLNVNQENSLKNLCLLRAAMEAQQSAAASIELFNKLAAAAEAKGGIPAASSETDQEIRNLLSVNLSQNAYNNTLQECMNSSTTDNIVNVIASKGVFADVNQVNKSFNECILTAAMNNAQISESAAQIKNEADSKSYAEGMQLAASGSLGSFGLVFSCCFVCIIVAVICFAVLGGKKGGPSNATSTMGNTMQLLNALKGSSGATMVGGSVF